MEWCHFVNLFIERSSYNYLSDFSSDICLNILEVVCLLCVEEETGNPFFY